MALIFKGPTQHEGEIVVANVLFHDKELLRGLDKLAVDIHRDNVTAGWWTDLKDGSDLLEKRNRGEMLMLSVTELDEAIDAHDGGLRDDKLPQYLGLHVELADCAIRVLDLIGAEQRRGGKFPLVVYREGYGAITVAYLHEAMLHDRRDVHRMVLRIVSALSKALDEGYRRDKVGIARFFLTLALFRIIALCVIEDIPLFEIIEAKREFNSKRADHKVENRQAEGGKKC